MTDTERNPIEILREAVRAQTGPARAWHLDDLVTHEPRYLADLALLRAIAPRGALLEIGSAPCHMTALLKLSGCPVVGVDIDPERVAGLIGRLGLDVRHCDVERSPLPFGDEAFGCVMLCEVFEHLRIDPEFVLSEVNRVLEPGGLLLLTTPNVYSLPSLGRYLSGRSVADPLTEFGKLRQLGHMGHVREYSGAEVSRFLAAWGFSVDSIRHRSHANLWGWKRRLLRLAYRLVPRGMRREIVVVARKTAAAPRLEPLIPLAPHEAASGAAPPHGAAHDAARRLVPPAGADCAGAARPG